MTAPTWEALAAAKKEDTLAQIPKEWLLDQKLIEKHQQDILQAPYELMTEAELAITDVESGVVLAKKLALAELSAVEVAKAFMHRAAIATQLTNCGTEIFFEAGLKRAAELDDYLAEHGKTVGCFHGLPISVKDCLNVEGVDTTLGFVVHIGNAGKLEQSVMTRMLVEAGAVLYIKTNIPQTMMTADSENNVFGRTLNPNNDKLTAGGSSGGEGALVRQKGSIFGVGTDVAGSIRIPSACCGTYGFKPSADRLPYGKQLDVVKDIHIGILPCIGPLARNFADLKFFFKNILDLEPWKLDYTTLNIPHQEVSIERKLVIGVLLEDPKLPVHPPVKQNLLRAAKLLEEAGHQVVMITNHPDYDEAWRISFAQFCIQVEGEVSPLEPMFRAGEPLIKSLGQSGIEHYVPKMPSTMKEVVSLLREEKSMSEAWHSVFQDNHLDVLLSPVAPSSAPPHDTYGIAPYTVMWNLMNYPALAIPFGVTEGDYEEDHSRYPEHLDGIYAKYDNETYQGGLGSIQVVAPTYTDEKLLAAGEIIDAVLNKK